MIIRRRATSSPQISRAPTPKFDTAEANTLRVPGTYIGTQNFGTLEFSGAGRTRGIRIRTFDAAGRHLDRRAVDIDE